jgi:hypothetical protein
VSRDFSCSACSRVIILLKVAILGFFTLFHLLRKIIAKGINMPADATISQNIIGKPKGPVANSGFVTCPIIHIL